MATINLRIPGPTPVPPEVAAAGAMPMVNHRGPEFAASFLEVTKRLKPFFGTEQDPLVLTGSGTGALEAAIVNVASPGDEVLSVTGGVFGDRWASIAEAFGATVHRLQCEWGTAVTREDVLAAVERYPHVKAILLTHNETSTGVTNNVGVISAALHAQYGDRTPLILVDGVSSIGALPFSMDAWGVDVAVTGSQKAWMSPPGAAMVTVSERGWEAHAVARMPRFYWDFTKARKNGVKGTTPFTPAVGIVHGMQVALRMMSEEEIEAVFARHRDIGRQVREGIQNLGLELFAQHDAVSDTVTAVRVPPGVDASNLVKNLRTQHHVVVGSGQDWLKGAIFRIGHMGWVHQEDIDHLLASLEVALNEGRLEQAG